MMIKGLAHTALNVADMEKSVAFYCGVLGFKKAFEMPKPETGEPWIVYLYCGGGQFIELFYGGVNYTEYSNDNIGFSHLCFEVRDIHEIADAIEKAWQCWVRDPDRNRIELMQVGEGSPQVNFLRSVQE